MRERRSGILAGIRLYLHGADDPALLSLANHMDEVDDWVEADVLNEIDIAQLGHELEQLRAIDGALARIEAGTYGICTVCGEAIAVDRMRAYPSAQSCLSCQEGLEKSYATSRNHSL